MSSADTEAPENPAPEVDEARQALLDTLTAEVGDGVVLGSAVAGGDLTVRVANDRWHDAVAACQHKLRMDYFCFIGGMDWLDNPVLSGEKSWGALPEEEDGADEDGAGEAGAAEDAAVASPGMQTGVAGGDTRFQVLCRLYSTKTKLGITLKVDLDEADPRVQTISDLYAGADWHEREAWEMYGFQFDGHTGLRHIYLPGGFEGNPLRKDFPLLAREVKPWPGLVDVEPLPGEAEGAEGAEEAAE